MIKPLALYIGLRYTRAKRRNHFISFISLASLLGIALGVMVLITVLSVMNGFNYQIKSRLFAMVPQVTIQTNEDISKTFSVKIKALKTFHSQKTRAIYQLTLPIFYRAISNGFKIKKRFAERFFRIK